MYRLIFFNKGWGTPKQVSFESHWKTLGYPAPGDSKFSQVRSILSDCRLWLSGTATIDITEKCTHSRGLVPSSPLMHVFGRSLRGYLKGCIISREQSPAAHTHMTFLQRDRAQWETRNKPDSPWPSRRCLLPCIFEKAFLCMQAGLEITAILLP